MNEQLSLDQIYLKVVLWWPLHTSEAIIVKNSAHGKCYRNHNGSFALAHSSACWLLDYTFPKCTQSQAHQPTTHQATMLSSYKSKFSFFFLFRWRNLITTLDNEGRYDASQWQPRIVKTTSWMLRMQRNVLINVADKYSVPASTIHQELGAFVIGEL